MNQKPAPEGQTQVVKEDKKGVGEHIVLRSIKAAVAGCVAGVLSISLVGWMEAAASQWCSRGVPVVAPAIHASKRQAAEARIARSAKCGGCSAANLQTPPL